MYLRTIAMFLLVLISAAIAQENLTESNDVQIEVLTSELQKTNKPQVLQVAITCDRALPNQAFSMSLSGMEALMILTAARLDDQALWLIKAPEANENKTVMAWNMTDDKRLQLLPGDWTVPFRLELELQCSLTSVRSVQDSTSATIDLQIIRGASVYRAVPVGRGNLINLK